MKILVGEFVTESNANIPTICTIEWYDIGLDEDCIQKMEICEVFERNDVTPIPSIYADAGAVGVVKKNVFTYIEHMFIDTLKENLHEVDGIFPVLHGASKVEELGSGDHHILKELRKLAGPYLPIAIVCDPHGNLCKEYAESATVLRSYRESPHMDTDETVEKVAKVLCELLKRRRDIRAVYRRLPLTLGGERGVPADEPVSSTSRYTDRLEKDDRISGCSQHAGYIRRDCDVADCSIIVVLYNEQGLSYVQEATDRLAAYIWEKYHELHYIGLTISSSRTLQMAPDFQDEPVFITNSDGNVASGATGWDTGILRQMLQTETTKKFLFATICDLVAYQALSACETGEGLSFTLGIGFDELSSAMELDAVVKNSGNLTGFMTHNHTSVFERYVNAHIKETSIDIMVMDTGWAVCELRQFVSVSIGVDTYDVIVVKQGYIFPDFKVKGELCVVSLTGGVTLQDTARLPFRRVMRPMFPIDDT